MASELSRDELRRLARMGAQKRLEELRQEEAAIRAAFPDLEQTGGERGSRRSRKAGRRAAAAQPTAGAGKRKAKRRRAPMTAAQKRAVSERMKKYWAARRKAEE